MTPVPWAGVWVFGPSRSGTSMLAGALRACGVHFGYTGQPTPSNPHGNLENVWWKHQRQPHDGPQRWFDQLAVEGWHGSMPWGLKCGVRHHAAVRELRPTVAVLAIRDVDAIEASRARAGFLPGAARDQVRRCGIVATVSRFPVVPVNTHRLAGGDFEKLTPALELLGLELDHEAVERWIDPGAWHG